MKKSLAIIDRQLPDNIEDLKKFIIIGEEVLKAHKLQLNAIQKVGMAQGYYDAKLVDGQRVAEIVLEAQGKLGKILSKTIKERGDTSLGYQERTKTLPPSITKKQSHIAQSVAKNPEIVTEVIRKAEKNKEIPTTKNVLTEIRNRKKENKRQKKLSEIKKKAENYEPEKGVRIYQGDFSVI